MTNFANAAALIAVLGTGVVYGTDVFCAMVLRPAFARIDDAALVAVTGYVHRDGDRRMPIPGVLAGATFAFVLSLGDFLAPLLLGGPSGIMISNIVVSLFGAAYNWPLGAAISLCMLVLVVSLLFVSERLEKKWSFS